MKHFSRSLVRTFAAAAVMMLAMTACGTPGGGSPDSDTPEPETSSSNGYTSAKLSPGVTPSPSETSAPPSGTASGTPSPGVAIPAGRASLKISIKALPETAAQEFVLECDDGKVATASTLPDAGAACARILELGTDFFRAKPDPNTMCTQQYGGPQTADIAGTLNGQPVAASFSLTDGCQIARWNALAPVLGTGGAS